MDVRTLRQFARQCFDKGVQAANPATSVDVTLTRTPLPQVTGRHVIIAIGKASCAMIEAALGHVPRNAALTAICVTNPENAREIPGVEVFASAHPVPDQVGLSAGRRVIHCLKDTRPSDHVLFLISGGGSALLPCPVKGVTLADKIAVNEILLRGGLSIGQMNLVRQNLSIAKGGGLAALARPAPIRTLAVSDVVGDDPRIIASGPTALPLGSAQEAAALLRAENLWDDLPQAVKAHLDSCPLQTEQTDPPDVEIICSNSQSLSAIARACHAEGWSAAVVSAGLEGDVTDVAADLVAEAKAHPVRGPDVRIWGGETTVTVTGSGTGGRNQELALRFAALAQDLPQNWVFLSGGTDGRDGPTEAAGGIVDAGTLTRVAQAGADLDQTLRDNNSTHALTLSKDLLTTGPTGTNVADIVLLLRA